MSSRSVEAAVESSTARLAKILSLDGEVVGEIALPPVFSVPHRPDLVRRAYLAAFTASRQPQGRDPMAGKRTTAESWGVGYGIARIPRVKGRGYPRASQGAFAPMTVGGYRVKAPRVEKVIVERINKKEKRLATASAIAATADRRLVVNRGHVVPDGVELPIVVTGELEELRRTSEVVEFLKRIGVWEDVERVKRNIHIRAGKGKMRGRRYKKGRGPLIVVYNSANIMKAARNIPGVDVANVRRVSILELAPGGVAGRLTIWTEPAIKFLEERFRGVVG